MFKGWYFSIGIVAIILVSSCQSDNYDLQEPDDLISKDTMVMVLKDLTLMESHLQTKYVQLSNYYKSLKLSGDLITSKYNLTPDRIERSLIFYGSKQEEMQEIYASILDTLTIQSNLTMKQLPENSIQQKGIIPKR